MPEPSLAHEIVCIDKKVDETLFLTDYADKFSYKRLKVYKDYAPKQFSSLFHGGEIIYRNVQDIYTQISDYLMENRDEMIFLLPEQFYHPSPWPNKPVSRDDLASFAGILRKEGRFTREQGVIAKYFPFTTKKHDFEPLLVFKDTKVIDEVAYVSLLLKEKIGIIFEHDRTKDPIIKDRYSVVQL